jgi:bifunctional non-homologous end joining protein LigD
MLPTATLSKSLALADFVLPCEPTLTSKPPTGEGWIHEIKHDGWRIIALHHGGRLNLWSRKAREWSDSLTSIATALRELGRDVVLDGEAVTTANPGFPDFIALRSLRGRRLAHLLVFDILSLEGRDLRHRPLMERRAILAKLLADAPTALHLAEHLDGDGAVIFDHACRLGFEGIVSKVKDSPYRSGRSTTWLRTKNKGYRRRDEGPTSEGREVSL